MPNALGNCACMQGIHTIFKKNKFEFYILVECGLCDLRNFSGGDFLRYGWKIKEHFQKYPKKIMCSSGKCNTISLAKVKIN